jgi:BirA family biotin operon repressor/biotin-[acetyl-CoA-carboxylase] ligase
MVGMMFNILHYDTIGSTNDEARRLAVEGATHGTVVHADEQKSGRGRLSRTWHSPPGNLYMSVLLRLPVEPVRLAELSFVAAVSVADAVTALLPPRAKVAVKWPNDVLVDGGKIAGILLEGVDGTTILGIGLNVLRAPASVGYKTATLVGCGGIATVDGARDLLLQHLGQYLALWLQQGFAPIRAAWLARGHPVGTPLRATLHGQPIEGRFAGLGSDGALLLDTDAGRQRIVAGDVMPA